MDAAAPRATDSSWNYTVIGRLRDGVSPAQADDELFALKPGLHRDLREISEARSQAIQWMTHQRWLGEAGRDTLLILLGAVAFLLLMACVNVASLQLVRGVTHRRELATRSAPAAQSSARGCCSSRFPTSGPAE